MDSIRGTRETLGQLARRALNQAPLCLGDFVSQRLTVEARSC